MLSFKNRLTRRLFMWALFCIILYIICWTCISLFRQPRAGNFLYTCNTTMEYQKMLEKLLYKVHLLLDSWRLEHFLCYGTLWGHVRMAKFLPWAEKAQLCVLQDEFKNVTIDRLKDAFTGYQMRLTYSVLDGVYTVNFRQTDQITVEMIAFVHDDKQHVYKRTGFRRALKPPHCDWTPSLDCFPENLLQKPLPRGPLYHHTGYPVPMGGIELLKYHYADNWWKTVITKNCNMPGSIGLLNKALYEDYYYDDVK